VILGARRRLTARPARDNMARVRGRHNGRRSSWIVAATSVAGAAVLAVAPSALTKPIEQEPVPVAHQPPPVLGPPARAFQKIPGLKSDIGLFTSDVGDAETVAVAVAPGGAGSKHCPDGRLLVASGPRNGARNSHGLTVSGVTILLHDLNKDGDAVRERPLFAPKGVEIGGYDSQFVRTANGELLLVHVGTTDGPPDFSTLSGELRTEAKDAFKKWSEFNGGARGVYVVWRSRDCGATWKSSVVLDAATAVVDGHAGQCGWPQFASSRITAANKDHPPADAFPFPSSFDRQEFYADPWDQKRVYLSMMCTAGRDVADQLHETATTLVPTFLVGHQRSRGLVFASTDDAHHFHQALSTNKLFPPLAMTSLRGSPKGKGSFHAGPLFVFACQGSAPVVTRIDSAGDVDPVTREASLEHKKVDDCDRSGDGGKPRPGGYFYNLDDLAVARVLADANTVRIAYPHVGKDGWQSLVAMRATVPPRHSKKNGGRPPAVTNSVTKRIRPDARHSMLPSFVESDRVDLKDSDDEDRALLYWIEGKGHKITERFAIADGASKWTKTGSLATGGRSWTVKDDHFEGDYLKGAFIGRGTYGASFLPQWPETGVTTCRLIRSVHYRVVPIKTKATPPAPEGPTCDLVVSKLDGNGVTVTGPLTCYVCGFGVPVLAPGHSASDKFGYCRPGTLTGHADPQNAIVESDESNNLKSVSAKCPNLLISATGPESITVRNDGDAAAGPFVVRVSGGGESVYELAFAGLAAGATDTRQTDCVATAQVATVDADNQVSESDEADNEHSTEECKP
jgi:CARDB